MSEEKFRRDLNVNRRKVLGLVAGGVAGIMVPQREAVAAGGEEVASFRRTLSLVSAEMRSDRIRENLTQGPPEIIQKILAQNRLTLPPLSALRDSPLNPESLFPYPMLLGSQADVRGRGRRRLTLIGAGSPTRQVFDLAEAVNGRVAHGNATAISEQAIITAGHLAPVLEHLPEVTMLSATQTDLAVALIPGMNFSPDQTVDIPERIGDRDVHGQFVVIPGIDPDATVMYRGMYKVYDGLAFQMTPAMVDALFSVDKNVAENVRLWHWAQHSLCLVIPDGESQPHRPGESQSRAAGMSGSPVFMLRDGRYVFVGVFWGVTTFSHEGKKYSLGLFLGPDTINQLSSMLSAQRRRK